MLRNARLGDKCVWRRLLAFGGALLVSSCSAGQPPVSDSAADLGGTMDRTTSHQSLRQQLRMHGRLPVVVVLKDPGSRVTSEARQQAMLADIQERVIDRLIRATGSSREALAIKTFSVTPALALQIDERALDALLADPAVSHVAEDSAAPPAGF
jgi:hypothetical protein